MMLADMKFGEEIIEIFGVCIGLRIVYGYVAIGCIYIRKLWKWALRA